MVSVPLMTRDRFCRQQPLEKLSVGAALASLDLKPCVVGSVEKGADVLDVPGRSSVACVLPSVGARRLLAIRGRVQVAVTGCESSQPASGLCLMVPLSLMSRLPGSVALWFDCQARKGLAIKTLTVVLPCRSSTGLLITQRPW